MPINGTNFSIPQIMKAKIGNWFASHNYSIKSTLCYKIVVSILGGDLVWIQDPYPARHFSNIKIFNKVLRHFLEPGKQVEVDNSYVGAATKIKCPDNPCNPVGNKGIKSHSKSQPETINGCFRTWGILKRMYCHNIRRHGEVFWAIAIITQLAISNGSLLFSVEYED
jgi:hypothetical protein